MMFNQESNYFNDVEEAPYTQDAGGVSISPSRGGGGDQSIQIGSGQRSFNVDLNGMWIGAARFASAPFRVNMDGDTIIRVLNNQSNLLIDDLGINSLYSFPSGSKEKSDDQTVTGTTWQDVLGLSHIITGLPRPANIIISAVLSGFHDDVDARMDFQFIIDGVAVGSIFSITQEAAAANVKTASGIVVAQLPAGDSEIVVQARSSNANDGEIQGSVLPCYSHYVLLGR